MSHKNGFIITLKETENLSEAIKLFHQIRK